MTDSHIHLCNEKVFSVRHAFFQYAKSKGIGRFLSCTASLSDFDRQDIILHEDTNGEIYAFYGVHPWYANEAKANLPKVLDMISERIKSGSAVGIGEIGLDALKPDFPQQKELFYHQVNLAAKTGIPFVVHNVKADMEVIEILREIKGLPSFILHSFSGAADKVKTFAELGAYFSFSGRITRRKTEYIRQIMRLIPMERILVESDFDGTDTGFEHYDIVQTYEFIAEFLKIDYKELKDTVDNNIKKVLGL